MTKKWAKRKKMGEVKLAILEELFLNPEKKLRTSDVRQMLREKLGIRQRRGVFRHLKELRSKGLLAYDSTNFFYYLPSGYKTSKYWEKLVNVLGIKDEELWERLKRISMIVSEEAAFTVSKLYWDEITKKTFKELEKRSRNKLNLEVFRIWISTYFSNFLGWYRSKVELDLLHLILSNLKIISSVNDLEKFKESVEILMRRAKQDYAEVFKNVLVVERNAFEMIKGSKIPKKYQLVFYELRKLVQDYLGDKIKKENSQ